MLMYLIYCVTLLLITTTTARSSYLGNLKVIEPLDAKAGVVIDTAPSVVYHQSYSQLNGKVVVTPSRGSGRSYNAPAVIPAVRDFQTVSVGHEYAAPSYGPVYRPGL
ncbi:uncharacterized protein LOC129912338 [Episyrphus balteatus]|uniref:uncharacterized protein LOC129912338 n=1 Tax=Episyrphus balteatus TaxID=286459 RepID=UPI00248500C8|nr:uncharacterized protein LOC129912338 [Episyrphus balteatus]